MSRDIHVVRAMVLSASSIREQSCCVNDYSSLRISEDGGSVLYQHRSGTVTAVADICDDTVVWHDGIAAEPVKSFADSEGDSFLPRLAFKHRLTTNYYGREERILAVADTFCGLVFVKSDRREDLEREHSGYRIVDERHGYEFSLDRLSYWTRRYSGVDWNELRVLLEDKLCHPTDIAFEIAKLLGGDSVTDAKRLVSRVRGDTVWM